MPTVNTDISAVNPDLNQGAMTDTAAMPPFDPLNQPISNTSAVNPGVTPPSNLTMSPDTTLPNNPAANLAGGMGADLGPDPAAMSIPSMVPQENLAPSMPQGTVPQDDINVDNLMPPSVNGELAGRPDSVLPPPPQPPVDQSTMAPPA